MPADGKVGIVVDRVTTAICQNCGALVHLEPFDPFAKVQCSDCAHILTVPGRLGPFLLLELLNTGGMGGVYLAKDETLGRLVAVKVMLASLGSDPALVETFRREAQSAARLNHPHVAQIYSFGQEKGQPYIVMELVSGERFDRLVERKQPLDQALVLRIAIEIAEGLSAADEIGLIHGDIKPENILLDEKNQAKLVDFGIAAIADQSRSEGVWGTPYYIAPEKVKRQKTDARSDIYSLGATLYHALTGRPPFEGVTPLDVVRARFEKDPVPPRTLRPDMDEQVEQIILRMLQQQPALRYPTYASLLGDLRRALEAVGGDRTLGTGKSIRIVPRKRPTLAARPALDVNPKGPDEVEKLVLPPNIRSPAPGPTPEQRRRRRRRVCVTLLVLLLLAAAGAAGVLGARTWLRAKERDQAALRLRLERVALQQAQQAVVAPVAACQQAATNVLRAARAAAPFYTRVTNAYAVIWGRPFEEPQPAEPAPVAAAATNAEPAPAPAAPADTTPPDTAEPAGTAAVAEAVGEAAPQAQADQPEQEAVLRLATEAAAEMRKIRAACDEARPIAAKALAVRAAVQAATNSAEATAAAQDLPDAKPLLEKEKRVRQAIKALEPKARLAEAQVTEMRKRKVAREQEEARLRQEEERRALAESEAAAVTAARTQSVPLVREFRFEEAQKAFDEAVRGMKTPEARQAAALVQQVYGYMVDLKKSLIEHLNAEPFRWGWPRGRGASEDILGASEQGLKLRDGVVAWNEVRPAQLAIFVDRYLNSKTLRSSQRGKVAFGFALYCYENGAAEAGAKYLERALEFAPSLRDDAAKMAPGR